MIQFCTHYSIVFITIIFLLLNKVQCNFLIITIIYVIISGSVVMNNQNKEEILICLRNGESIRQVAKKFHLDKTFVQRLKKKSGVSVPTNKGGRPKKICDRDVRHLANLVTSTDAVTPAAALNILQIDASKWTARRALKKIGVKAAEKKKKPMLTKRHVRLRKDFVAAHEHWTVADWDSVIWSDETKINRFQSDGRAWYWTKDPDTIQPNQVRQTVKHGGGCIMVWGCISKDGVGPLVRIDGIMRKEQYLSILQQNLPDVVEKMGLAAEKVIFQQDNDPKHTAHLVKDWLKKQKFGVMTWPPQSPDMNPIENLWSHVKSQLAKYASPPKGVNELWERTKEVWEAIPPEFVQRYTQSLPNRIQELKKAKGYWTSY